MTKFKKDRNDPNWAKRKKVPKGAQGESKKVPKSDEKVSKGTKTVPKRDKKCKQKSTKKITKGQNIIRGPKIRSTSENCLLLLRNHAKRGYKNAPNSYLEKK